MKLRIFLKIRQFFEVLRVLRGSVQLPQNSTLFSVSLLGAGGFCTKLYIHSTHTFPRNSIFPIHDFTSLLQFLPPSLAFPYLGIVNRLRMLLIMWNFSTILHYQTHVLIAPFRSKTLSKTNRLIYVLTIVSKLLYLPNLQGGGASFSDETGHPYPSFDSPHLS